MSVAKTIMGMVAERGWALTLLYAAHRLLSSATKGHARIVPYVLVAQPIGANAFEGVRADTATVVRKVEPPDALCGEFPRPEAINLSRWQRGASCYAATHKGVFAGTIWIRREQYEEDEVRCTYVLLKPEISAWDFDVYVVPRFRLGRTMARMWQAVDRSLAEQGVAWSFSRISQFNPGSLQSHARLGATPVGWATFMVLGSVQIAALSQAPYLHVCVGEGRGPELACLPPETGVPC